MTAARIHVALRIVPAHIAFSFFLASRNALAMSVSFVGGPHLCPFGCRERDLYSIARVSYWALSAARGALRGGPRGARSAMGRAFVA